MMNLFPEISQQLFVSQKQGLEFSEIFSLLKAENRFKHVFEQFYEYSLSAYFVIHRKLEPALNEFQMTYIEG